MSDSALTEVLHRARGPMGPPVEVDLGVPGTAWEQLSRTLSSSNGFFVFNAGVQVFRVGEGAGWGPELGAWNAQSAWKDTYQGLADDLFCFGQDLFGVQFAIDGSGAVVTLDPEDGSRTLLGTGLDDWAAWLLDDPDTNGAAGLAKAWQDANGPLKPDERLLPTQFFLLGGGYEFANLRVSDATAAMRVRGPIARELHGRPDGSRVTFVVE